MVYDFSKSRLTPKEAIEEQKTLRDKIVICKLTKEVKTIGGADVSMNLFSKDGFAGFITLDYLTLEVIDHSVIKDIITFPYIPGLLSYREIPMLLKAWEKLKTKPDVLLVDGIGIAHPRRMGIATHLGILLNIPTIGCAKSVLIGTYDEPAIGCAKSVLIGTYDEPEDDQGSISYLYDKDEVVGAALRSKKNVKPIFISPGHLITLDESVEIVKKCLIKHKLPEPTRIAHNTVNDYRVQDMEKVL